MTLMPYSHKCASRKDIYKNVPVLYKPHINAFTNICIPHIKVMSCHLFPHISRGKNFLSSFIRTISLMLWVLMFIKSNIISSPYFFTALNTPSVFLYHVQLCYSLLCYHVTIFFHNLPMPFVLNSLPTILC